MTPLPNDGAEFVCRHTDHGPEERVIAVVGLTEEEWEELKPLGFTFRAVCNRHSLEAKDWLAL